MKYCHNKKPIPCIQYTGDNRQEVLDFISLYSTILEDGDLLGGNDYILPAKAGTWFIFVDGEVIRYQHEEDFFKAYSLIE